MLGLINRKVCNRVFRKFLARQNFSYVQGQLDSTDTGKGAREYFYFIDHQGQLFLDDAKIKNFTSCFKEQRFLQFFFKNLQLNNTDRYKNFFPYVSLCGRERNFIRCDDLPFVFTQLDQVNDLFYVNNINTSHYQFDPALIYVSDHGRFYYPLPDDRKKFTTSIGLIKSSLSIELFKSIQTMTNGEIIFNYKSHKYQLNSNKEFNLKMKDLLQRFSFHKPDES